MTESHPTSTVESWRLASSAPVFSLAEHRAYRLWRDAKLAGYPRSLDEVTVAVSALAAPTRAETGAILAACRRANMCLYRSQEHLGDAQATRQALALFARHFSLTHFEAHRSAEADGIVALEVVEQGGRLGYVPYTNRSIGWHTDGYYNYEGPARMIRSMLLHCVRSASHGGENGFLDHEIAYIRLRDNNPEFITALMHPEAMTIPANEETDGKVRAENTGPVFVINAESGTLTMRYTARKRNIRWRDDPTTMAAVQALERVLDEDPLIMRAQLEPGTGIICNNVLHDRTGFETSAQSGRLLFRIRSYDRVRDTKWGACAA